MPLTLNKKLLLEKTNKNKNTKKLFLQKSSKYRLHEKLKFAVNYICIKKILKYYSNVDSDMN